MCMDDSSIVSDARSAIVIISSDGYFEDIFLVFFMI